jgi:hypothetical protein
MPRFTGRERVLLAAGLCGWEVHSQGPDDDVLWLSRHRWIWVRYDRMGRVIGGLDHAQIGEGGPSIERDLERTAGRADRIIGWITGE